jgi:predicted glycoside hydrolase/deacetylase ChbG (UPF0249 family)
MAYVDNTRLLEALLDSHAHGHVTEECYNMFKSIAEQRINLLLKYDRKRYHDEMLAKCIDKCLKIWTSYSFKRDNAFAYFVTVIDNTCKLFFMQHADAKIVSVDEQEQRFRDSD